MQDRLLQLNEKLGKLNPDEFSATVGFDGFVDEIVEAVAERESFAAYTRMSSIAQLGERILQAAGLSTNIELVSKGTKLGGNGPILANALLQMGVQTVYIGTLGSPQIHPAFHGLRAGCTDVFSLAEPGHTDALEFNDGKIMLGKMESLGEITWDKILEQVGEGKLRQMFNAVDLVACVNWTMLPTMDEIWQGLLTLLEPRSGQDRPYFFVDLADPGKRRPADIVRALELIRAFSSGYKVILGLNRREASAIAQARGLKLSGPAADVELEEIVTALGRDLDLWCVVVHPTDRAGAVIAGDYVCVNGPYTANPQLTTGAGDNFNAGFCLGLMLKLGLVESLLLGKAVSGFYVRNTYSPNWEELQGFIGLWAERGSGDF